MVKHFCDICKEESVTEIISLPVLVCRGLNHFIEYNFETITRKFDICSCCLREIAKEFSEKTGIMGSDDE